MNFQPGLGSGSPQTIAAGLNSSDHPAFVSCLFRRYHSISTATQTCGPAAPAAPDIVSSVLPRAFLVGRSVSLRLGEPNSGELTGALILRPIGELAVRSCCSSFSASLVARCDLSRQHAELIDIPIPNEHLDRGHYCLIAVVSLGVASLLKPQMLELGDCRIRIVSHDPFPLQTWR